MAQRSMVMMIRELKAIQDRTERQLIQAAEDLRTGQETLDQIAIMVGILTPNSSQHDDNVRGENPLDASHTASFTAANNLS